MERELYKDNIEHSKQEQLVRNEKQCLDLLKYSTEQWNLFLNNINELNKLTNKDLKSALQNEVPFKWRWKSAFYYESKIWENGLSIRYSQSNWKSIRIWFNNDKYDGKPVTMEETIECIEYYEKVCSILQDFNAKLLRLQQSLQ